MLRSSSCAVAFCASALLLSGPAGGADDLAGTSWIVTPSAESTFIAIEFPEEVDADVPVTMPTMLGMRRPMVRGGTEEQPTLTLEDGAASVILTLDRGTDRIDGRLEARGGFPGIQEMAFALVRWTPPGEHATTAVFAGDLELPGGATMEMILELGHSENGASAAIGIPAQMIESYPAVATYVDGSWKIDANFGTMVSIRLSGNGAEGALEGTMSQSGFDMKLRLDELTEEEIAVDPRPQTPKPPFPYSEVEARIPVPQGHELAGTLLIPDGVEDPPVVVLVTGSGPQDRDETLMGHKPFLVLADALARRGIASLRYDDRGVGESTGDHASALTVDFADDALAAVVWLRAQDTVDSEWIGIIGHSEGGLVAPIAISKDPGIAFAVLMAGTGVDGGRILTSQTERIMEIGGTPPEVIEALAVQQEALMDSVRDEASEDEIRRRMLELSLAQVEAGRATVGDKVTDQLLASTRQQVETMEPPVSDWLAAFIRMDPRVYLSQMRCPVLALNGTTDVQVLSDLNLPEIERAVTTGGGQVTVIEYEGLNHLFQRSETGSIQEYALIRTTIEPEVLEDIAGWIDTVVGRSEPIHVQGGEG